MVAGPAEVEGSTLRIAELPAKSKYPVKVTVVACQGGRTTEPLCQSAEPVAFLAKGKKYTAHIYADDDRVATRTKLGIATQIVDSKTTLDAVLKAGGGQAIWIEPAK